ncbi:MAG: prenyltransferase/squalene oxidase repeat-containing protein [Candidatus Heimdallarchaeota archaeon]
MHSKILTQAIVDSIVSLGIREHADEVFNEIESVVTDPLNLFFKHSHWPSTLTLHGVPVELSIGIKSDKNHSFRYIVDIADYSQGMVSNWTHSLKFAKIITGINTDQYPQLWRLCTRHLNGIPDLTGSPMYGGIGYGRFGLKISELYFFKSWLSDAEFKDRFPSYASAVDRLLNQDDGPSSFQLEALEYEFTATGEMTRTKLLGWLDYKNSKSQFSEVAGNHPNLAPARKVFEHFQRDCDAYQFPYSIAMQLSLDQHTEPQPMKIFFPCYAWDWIHPKGFLDLVLYLLKTFSLNLWQLYTILNIFSEYKIPLFPTWMAIGLGEPHPSISFYFCPIFEGVITNPAEQMEYLPRTTPKKIKARNTIITRNQVPNHLICIEEMISRAIDYILATKETDGYWIDFSLQQGMSDEWVTAFVTAMLSKEPSLHPLLTSSIEWLQKRFRPGKGWGYNRKFPTDAETTALALLALHRLNTSLPEDACETLLRYRLPNGGYGAYSDGDLDHKHGIGPVEITSGVLLTQLEAGLIKTNIICDTVDHLLSQQRGKGGWNSFWWKDDLFATCRALHSLNAFIRFATMDNRATRLPNTIVQSAINVVKDTNHYLYTQAVPNEPFALGLWLSCWFATQGHVHYSRIDRILNYLRSQQQKDGQWLSVPIKRIEKTIVLQSGARSEFGFYLDSKCLITTTMVIEGLKAYYKALKVT